MKPTTLLTLCFLLFAFIINIPLAFSQDVAQQVLDSNGDPIFPGYRLYIMPVTYHAVGGGGGGVKLGKTGNSTCPVTVLQDYSKDEKGLAVKFTIPGISTGIIFTDITRLVISFKEDKPACAGSSDWVVVDGNDFPTPWVGISEKEHTEKHVLSGYFKIKRGDFAYKLVFCPNYPAPQSACFDIGRRDDKNGRRLVRADGHPYEVMFVKKPYSHSKY